MQDLSRQMPLLVLGLLALFVMVIGVALVGATAPSTPTATVTPAASPGAASIPVGVPGVPTETPTEPAPAAIPTLTRIVPVAPTFLRFATGTHLPVATRAAASTSTPVRPEATRTPALTSTSARS